VHSLPSIVFSLKDLIFQNFVSKENKTKKNKGMSDPVDRLPPLPTDQARITPDTSSTSNIPISDFRRNEARPIITDDGKYILSFFNILEYKHVIYIFEFD